MFYYFLNNATPNKFNLGFDVANWENYFNHPHKSGLILT